MTKKGFRFSAIGAEFDLDDMLPKKQSKDKPKVEEPAKKIQTKAKPKTTKKKLEQDSLQALAFGKSGGKKKLATTNGTSTPVGGAGVANNNKKGNKENGVSTNGTGNKQLSADWKSRDEQYVAEEHARELQEAILQSKLTFEANKLKQTQLKKKEDSSEVNKSKKKKKEKPITVSLSEFNSMDANKVSNVERNGPDTASKVAARRSSNSIEDNFFSDVDLAVRSTLQKETRQKKYAEDIIREKNKANSTGGANKSSSNSRSGAPVLVSISEVEKRDYEIQALNSEVDSLKQQLEKVKLRNKKLCEVLGTAEMREKGEVVMELHKVCRARDELSTEVASLCEQLEQEKTKNSKLEGDKHRKK